MQIDFTGAAELIDSAARIIKTFTEGLRDALKASIETVDLVSARTAQNRLREVHRRALFLVNRQGLMLMPSAEKYTQIPTAENWRAVREEIVGTLKEVEALSGDLMALRGDFLLEETYLGLLEAMTKREHALREVLEISEPPTTPNEMGAFREFLKSYVVLVRELQHMNISLGGYIRAREGGAKG
ncbi:hypothetical protein LPW11_20190 [Geomonas sp. RF6]|uniref:hypothetical protein n=1 Tax=Geomonas sp. RF6 TaxID=2897342 RepID=UPI001E5575CD|nr:hypothetical protein [Geomonas sp. RF6]UFS70181.1 hypothetical protein LPW11_20190 [Geomonas sp. RF6]